MKQPLIGATVGVGAVIAGEVVAAGLALALVAAGMGMVAAGAAAVVVGVLGCLVTIAGLPSWQWARLAVRWSARRERRLLVVAKRPASKDRTDVSAHG